MADAVSFNILVDISSGPDALLVSKVCNSSVVSSLEQRSLGGHWSESTCNLSVSDMSRGGTERFKQLEKNWFNIATFHFQMRPQNHQVRGLVMIEKRY